MTIIMTTAEQLYHNPSKICMQLLVETCLIILKCLANVSLHDGMPKNQLKFFYNTKIAALTAGNLIIPIATHCRHGTRMSIQFLDVNVDCETKLCELCQLN